MNLTLFAYLNIQNPMVAWEVAIGRVRSASDVTREKFGISVWAFSLLRDYAIKGSNRRFLNELLLESVRQRVHAEACSRLADLYFFESEYDAHAALERWDMPNRRDLISQVSFSANHLTKVDSEWITSYLASDEKDWMNHYWSGKALGAKPLIEVLASGIGFVKNRDLRYRAYQSIIERWPNSTPLLAMACCAFAEHGLEDIALVRPAIVESNGIVQGSHFIDIRDLHLNQDKIVSALASCKLRNEVPPMIIPDDGVTFFELPDLRAMDFTVANSACAAELRTVHNAAIDA